MYYSNKHISTVFDSLKSLGVYKIYGWETDTLMKAMKDNHSDIVEDWVSFVEDILKKETDENTNFYLINITKKLDLFKKRLEICNIVMRYIK